MCAFTPNASWNTSRPAWAAPPLGRATHARMAEPSLTFSVSYPVMISMAAPYSHEYQTNQSSVPDKKRFLVHRGSHGNIEKSYHHLFVGLISPANRRLRIGVVRIIARIVVPRDSLQFRSCL